MELLWGDDLYAEKKMADAGAEYANATILLDDIDVMRSRKNNARLWSEAVDQDTVIEYACGFENGDRFPRIIVARIPGFKLLFIISGNHRVAAILYLRDNGLLAQPIQIPVYLIRGLTPETLDLLTRSANRGHGRKQTDKEAIEHCRTMVRMYKTPLAILAKYFGLCEATLKRKLKIDTLRTEYGDFGNVDALADQAILKLDQLGFNDTVRKRAIAVVTAASPPSTEISLMVDDVKARTPKGEQHCIGAIKEWERRWRRNDELPHGPERTVAGLRRRFMEKLHGLYYLVLRGNRGQPFQSMHQIGITDKHDRHQFHQEWKETKRLIDGMFRESQLQDSEQRKDGTSVLSKARRQKLETESAMS